MNLEAHRDWVKVLRLIGEGAKFKQFKNHFRFFPPMDESEPTTWRYVLVDLRSVDAHPSEIDGVEVLLQLGSKCRPAIKLFVKTKACLHTVNNKGTQWTKVRPVSALLQAAESSGVELATELANSNSLNPG
jgi:hypothetical protein